MKTKNIFVLTSFVVYLYLFYHQSPGINFLIFSILLIVSTALNQPGIYKIKSWLLISFGVLLTGVGLGMFGNKLSLVGNILSLLALGGLTHYKEYSLIFAMIQTFLSYLVKPFSSIIDICNNLVEGEKEGVPKNTSIFNVNNLLKVVLPLLIVSIFIALYSNSNPIFSNFVQNATAELSADFIAFSIFGFLLVYIFFNQYYFAEIQTFDVKFSNALPAFNTQEQTIFRTTENEFGAAKLTFLLLNLLLLIVNILDIQYILDPNKEIIKHATLIHESVNNSITSVLVAIFVILYFFRGNLNFVSQNKSLKILALLWIIQNVLLLASCFYKNFDYISAHGLTHKRIGVYFYLLVVLVAVVFTWYKIAKQRSNMFLIRANSWSLFIILSLSSCVNWNKLILDYNLKYHPIVHDKYYLDYLDYSALPYLYPKYKNTKFDCFEEHTSCEIQSKILKLNAEFVQQFEAKSWQSWTWDEQRIYNAVKNNPKRK